MNYNKKTVYDVDVKGKKVLLRCDLERLHILLCNPPERRKLL